MSAHDQRKLLLEYRSSSEGRDGEVVDGILANIPGHCYRFGTLSPGVTEGEEFISCRGYRSGLISPSHCTIRVDDQGQYWIQNDGGGKSTISFYDTFVNSERVEGSESRLLKIGDIISLGAPEMGWAGPGFAPHPIYRVMEEGIRTGPKIDGTANEDGPKDYPEVEESPLDNGLILSKIMSYLPLPDLKSARLVNKMWKGEASILMEKKGKVSLNFGGYYFYLNPQNPRKVARNYLHEVKELKMQELEISLNSSYEPANSSSSEDEDEGNGNPPRFSPGEPLDEVVDDLRELLNSSNNFCSLTFKCWTVEESSFPSLFLALQELAGKLVELELVGNLVFVPEDLPPLPVMSNLRKFTHTSFGDAVRQKWVSLLVPLFAKGLEHFRCNRFDVAETYLQEFLKHEMPKLKAIEIEGRPITEKTLASLLQLKTPRTVTRLTFYYKLRSDVDCSLLEKLLFKNAKSLTHLDIWICPEETFERVEVKFPSFPKLEELKLSYKAAPSRMRIHWGLGDLDYTKDLPSLRKLSLVNWFRKSTRGYADEDDPVFNSFFPEGGAVVRCEGVKEVRLLEVKAQPRMDKIKETFPNAVLDFVSGEDWWFDYECESHNEYIALS